ncbi:MAG: right-handed parallel beta-helix repeat-containing protein [Actinobacteria bacterium]|nr:right-handed parallel beta-helix repeat-containing protein [Actinomycetota bacterium]
MSALIPYTDDNRCVCTLWTIDNCEISACRQYGIWVNNVSNCAVRNSEIKTCALHGINAYLCPNISIRDSIVDGCRNPDATRTAECALDKVKIVRVID